MSLFRFFRVHCLTGETNITILVHVTCREAGIAIWVQLFGACTPKIWDGRKRSKFGAVLDNFTF